MSRWAGRALIAGLVALCALNVVYIVRQWHSVAQVSTPRGSEAPDFAAPLLAGGRFHLADERGHPVVLVFWASWCAPCKAELPGVDALARRRAGRPTRIVAVNVEGDRDRAARGAAELHLTLPIAVEDGAASQAYKVETIPHTVLIDAHGKVAGVERGPLSEDELARAIDRLEGQPESGAR
jgi:thiol-disulfide isomerase/thioredoxin